VTASAAAAPPPSVNDALRRVSLRPVEGWLTLLPTAAMVVAFSFSLQDADWIPGPPEDSNFMPFVGLLGLAFGVLGAKVGWGRWRTHFVGALFAGLVLTLIVGGLVLGPEVGWDPQGLAQRVLAWFDVARRIWIDLAVDGLPFTSEYAHYYMVFGALVWAAGQLAGYTVFGHRRPLDAVVVIGLGMLANMALTSHNQLYLLVAFTAAALLLLVRTHVFEEQVTWARRKIGDPETVGQMYIQGGSAFVIAAILGSILLTTTASSAPLQGMWADLPSRLQGLSQWLLRFAPTGGDPRATGAISFSRDARTTGVWTRSDATAFRAQLQSGVNRDSKWRAGTYADYSTFGFSWSAPNVPTREIPTAAGATLLDGEADAPTTVGRREVRFTVTPVGYRDPTILSPNTIKSVDKAATAIVRGTDGWFTSVESGDSLNSYNVTALIPELGDVPGGITEAHLRTAGTAYPPELEAIYRNLPPDAMGPAATALLEQIRAGVRTPPGADPANAYDLARTMEDYLRKADHFQYDEDVRDLVRTKCSDVSTVECFAIIKRGYCEYYASTMAVLLRAAGVPSRVAYGFLHGSRDAGGLETVPASAAHWWVEVYFPGSGWVEFDPTGGGIGQPQPIPSGSAGPATPKPSFVPPTFRVPSQVPSTPVPTGTPGTGIGPFIAIGIILMIGVGALAFAAYRRTPNRPMHPDQAWGSVARLAGRIGLGPKPSQTVYEYAGALGDAVPAARVELTTIARAKVEVAYGRRDLGADRLRSIAQAYQRLRFAIIGLILRRGFRRRRLGLPFRRRRR
jgi:transglutaminase-like putative cysteine protease